MNTSYTRLSLAEREEISKGIWADESFTTIAKRIDRSVSTVSREVWAQVLRKKRSYHATIAHDQATLCAKKGRPRTLDTHARLRQYVYRNLRLEWSPEEIAKRLRLDYPQDMTMRISHETIYHHIYCLPRGELKKELLKCLRHQKTGRISRANAHYRKRRIEDIISISERPEEVKDRIVPGHWEGDLIVGKNHASALGTLVERTTRLTLLVPLKEKDAFAVRIAMAKAFKRIPQQFKKTLTYDRGSEMSQHKLFTKETDIQVYFADPRSPWQRGTNENTNGLIRQYFPKGTDFREVSLQAIRKAEQRLNGRPRKTLNFRTPSERFYELIKGQKIALGA
jgi:transposase, IS30 family